MADRRYPGAIVVRWNLLILRRELLDEFFAGWKIITPGETLTGIEFQRIVMLWMPQCPEDLAWVDNMLRTRIPAGKVLEWMV
jgi:hypothetical protein